MNYEFVQADLGKLFTGNVHELRESGALPLLLRDETEAGCEEGESGRYVQESVSLLKHLTLLTEQSIRPDFFQSNDPWGLHKMRQTSNHSPQAT